MTRNQSWLLHKSWFHGFLLLPVWDDPSSKLRSLRRLQGQFLKILSSRKAFPSAGSRARLAKAMFANLVHSLFCSRALQTRSWEDLQVSLECHLLIQSFCSMQFSRETRHPLTYSLCLPNPFPPPGPWECFKEREWLRRCPSWWRIYPQLCADLSLILSSHGKKEQKQKKGVVVVVWEEVQRGIVGLTGKSN